MYDLPFKGQGGIKYWANPIPSRTHLRDWGKNTWMSLALNSIGGWVLPSLEGVLPDFCIK